MSQNQHSPSPAPEAEFNLHEVLAAKVRAGQPIHITGPVDGAVGQMAITTVARLRRETGLPVTVIFS